MAALHHLYALAARAAASLLRAASPLNTKLARGVAARRDTLSRLSGWAASARDPARPLVWLHAPSVGEALMAQAIAESLRAQQPDVQIVLTIFSPSAERVLGRMPVDVADYLPWDTPADAAAIVRILRPAAIGFVRTEVWPLIMAAAQQAGARAALVNAVLAPSSSRLRWPARTLLSDVYARLDAVGAVSAAHGARFQSLGVRASRVEVTGDARFDQVLERIASIDRGSDLLRHVRGDGTPLLVAGSTWAPDERVLVGATAALVRAGRLRLVIAPHEPNDTHLAALERTLGAAGLSHARLATIESGSASGTPPVLLIDRVGVLADVYAVADFAYVGGGFGTAGLHSVAEPAALGVPVLFGPRHGNAIEATELANCGGGAVVDAGDALRARLTQWLEEPGLRARIGRAARAFTQERAGGAEANARLLLRLAGEAAALARQ